MTLGLIDSQDFCIGVADIHVHVHVNHLQPDAELVLEMIFLEGIHSDIFFPTSDPNLDPPLGIPQNN